MARIEGFEPPAVFTTARLILRRPALSDAEAMYAYARDPEVTRYMDWRTHADMRDTMEFLHGCAPRWASGEEFAWVLTVKPDDRAIGTFGCRVRDHAAEIGYVLDRGHWRRGYATEAARAVVAWAVSVPAIVRVCATCDAENGASAHVLEKAGMTREGTLRCWKVRPNIASGPRDTLIYALIVAAHLGTA